MERFFSPPQNENVWIINTGTELLNGITVNTNASWLARKLSFLGFKVKRIIVVPDEFEEFSNELKRALENKAGIVITTGGLGPTYDDNTLLFISKSLKIPYEVNEDALNMVKKVYEAMSEPLTKEREKMAKMPKGSIPLKNPVGTAPGMMLYYSGSYIISLPGVPSEMKAIFEEDLESVLKMWSKKKVSENIIKVRGIMESAIAPLIEKASKKYLNAYIKTHPKGKESNEPYIEIQILATGNTEEEANKLASEITSDIINEIETKFSGGKIER
ncbi:nicotinamide mononucleotide deamidase-related protein [Fervidicoccus fontis]|nr:nicotinamide mononucleotide deamidase-related protein [Fervidicoccus fontis]MBE9390507.1 nicotinamide mononucleotide deamidase-related protein [Fervidicoccus fontis]